MENQTLPSGVEVMTAIMTKRNIQQQERDKAKEVITASIESAVEILKCLKSDPENGQAMNDLWSEMKCMQHLHEKLLESRPVSGGPSQVIINIPNTSEDATVTGTRKAIKHFLMAMDINTKRNRLHLFSSDFSDDEEEQTKEI